MQQGEAALPPGQPSTSWTDRRRICGSGLYECANLRCAALEEPVEAEPPRLADLRLQLVPRAIPGQHINYRQLAAARSMLSCQAVLWPNDVRPSPSSKRSHRVWCRFAVPRTSKLNAPELVHHAQQEAVLLLRVCLALVGAVRQLQLLQGGFMCASGPMGLAVLQQTCLC